MASGLTSGRGRARMARLTEPTPGSRGRRCVTRRLLTLAVAGVAALVTVGCSAAPTTTAAAPTTSPGSVRVTIEMNHCWVEPVSFDGEQWNVPFRRQFGWGGLQPRNWQGTGVMVRLGENRARFDDDGGASVVFLPVDDPRVTPVETALCA